MVYSPSLRYLDVGCGDALFVWGGNVPENVVCLDLDVFRHTTVNADALHLPFRKIFDYAFLLEILEHMDDVESAIKEAFRVANSVVISYPDEDVETFLKSQAGLGRRDMTDIVRKHLEFLRQHGLVEFVDDPKVHAHTKDKERIKRDVEVITELCGKSILLSDGMYRGWGWICEG